MERGYRQANRQSQRLEALADAYITVQRVRVGG
jgi:hypothetical protein